METMITRAILEDGFTPALRKIAGAQSEYSRRTMAINTASNVALGVGGGIVAFGVMATRTAAQIDEIKKSLVAVEGAQKAAYDMHYVDNYSRKSKQTYMDLAEAAAQIGIRKVGIDQLKNIADIAAATRAPLEDIVDLYARLRSGQIGFALGAKGFARYGIRTQDVFAAEGISGYKPGEKIEGKITADQAMAGIAKVIQQMHYAGLDAKLATTTMSGSFSMVEDSFSRLQVAFGKANLQPTITMFNNIAAAVNKVTDIINRHPNFGVWVELGGIALIIAGGIGKAVVALRTYSALMSVAAGATKLAAAAAETEGAAATVAATAGVAGAVAVGVALAAVVVTLGAIAYWWWKVKEASDAANSAAQDYKWAQSQLESRGTAGKLFVEQDNIENAMSVAKTKISNLRQLVETSRGGKGDLIKQMDKERSNLTLYKNEWLGVHAALEQAVAAHDKWNKTVEYPHEDRAKAQAAAAAKASAAAADNASTTPSKKIDDIISKAVGGRGLVTADFLRSIGVSALGIRQMDHGTYAKHQSEADKTKFEIHLSIDGKELDTQILKVVSKNDRNMLTNFEHSSNWGVVNNN